MTYEQFIAGREQDIIPEREVWDAAQAAAQAEVVDRLRALVDADNFSMIALHYATARAILAHIDALTARLEISPDAPEYDGIYCRDETIRLLEQKLAKVAARESGK
jgi:hypothetical protein